MSVQYWRNAGYADINLLQDGTLDVSNTEPACKQAPDGSYQFLNNASQPLYTPPGVDADGFWTVRLCFADGYLCTLPSLHVAGALASMPSNCPMA